MKSNYKAIDLAKVMFSCIIPFLHIEFENTMFIEILRQYMARLGVPFFFAVSGMFLSNSISQNGTSVAFKRYFKRIGQLLIIWLVIYIVPLWLSNDALHEIPLRVILFKTPAYLWYLTALLFACILFCFVKNRIILYVISILLYITGTFFSEGYEWITYGVDLYIYKTIFLTTRNGIFFALPLMCTGEIVNVVCNKYSEYKEKHLIVPLFVSYTLLAVEIFFVRKHASSNSDCSMYFLLPIFIFFLVWFIRTINNNNCIVRINNTKTLRLISSAIYMMQYGIIVIGSLVVDRMYIFGNRNSRMLIVYVAVIVIPIVFVAIFRKRKICTILF